MPKAKYAARGRPKPKSVKAKVPLSSKRKLSRFGKRQKPGHEGSAVEYIARTRAVKKLQITLRDFRRLCILKGIYPREPRHKSRGVTQTFYHWKDIAYLAHEPLLQKFREFKVFMKRVRKALNRHDRDDARRMYEQQKPVYTLDHVLKERYPRFEDALSDLDDALSMLALFAALPAEGSVRPERTSAAARLVREWLYYVARSHSLRKVFFSVKGAYFQAEVRGVAVTWLQPWAFAQAPPSDVDYRVMLTFMELHEVLLRFVMFKLYAGIGLAYPPAIRADLDGEGGGELAAVDALPIASAPGASAAAVSASAAAAAAEASAAAAPLSAEMRARLGSVKDLVKRITAAAEPTAASAAAAGAPAAAGVKRPRGEVKRERAAAQRAAAVAGMYDFVDAEEAGGSAAAAAAPAAGAAAGAAAASSAAAAAAALEDLRDMAEFAGTPEARAVLVAAERLRAFGRLFGGLHFFLGREVPRALFEFLVCAFRGRVGWDGPGSPYGRADARITHEIVDRPETPAAAAARVPGREYVQPQWVADCVNTRMLLPTAKYAPGATLPPHLSPFADDAAEGYTPAYRVELDRLRAAAAAVGRLADVIEGGAEAATAGAAGGAVMADGEGDGPGAAAAEGDDDDEEGGAGGEAAGDEDDDEEEEEGDGDEDDDDDEEEDDDDEEEDESDSDADLAEELEAEAAAAAGSAKKVRLASPAATPGAAGSTPAAKGGRRGAGGKALTEVEAERRALAASMLSARQRKTYEKVSASRARSDAATQSLHTKAAALQAKGEAGVGRAAAAKK